MESKGVKFLSIKENIDTSTPYGRFTINLLSSLYEMELELIKDSFSMEYPDEAQDLWTNNEEQDGLLYSATEVDDYT